MSPGSIGVFYRVNSLSRVIEEAFVRKRIPYAVYGGMRFYERREIKDLMAYLRIIVNPHDEEALARIINVPARGMGEKSLLKLRAYAEARAWPRCTPSPRRGARQGGQGGRAQGARGLQADLRGDRLARGPGGRGLAAQGHHGDHGARGGPEGRDRRREDRLNNVRELIASASGRRDIGEYLEEKALMSAVDEEAGERISVMTLHMSKGLEFDYVFILGLEGGAASPQQVHGHQPRDRGGAQAPLRGHHRARGVYLSWSRLRSIYGREVFQVPSGFLSELVS